MLSCYIIPLSHTHSNFSKEFSHIGNNKNKLFRCEQNRMFGILSHTIHKDSTLSALFYNFGVQKLYSRKFYTRYKSHPPSDFK